MKVQLDCSPYHDNACLCFAAGIGEECSFCSTSGKCLSEERIMVDCPNESRWDRRAKAEECGKQKINLISGPPQVLPGSILPPWSGKSLAYELRSVFRVRLLRFKRYGQTPVMVEISPQSALRLPTLSSPCSNSSCVYPLAVPFVENITFRSGNNEDLVSLNNVELELEEYFPVDGVVTALGGWTMCSNGCGEGNQSRLIGCRPPVFGGLPCFDAEDNLFEQPINATRACIGNYDCGTNWRVLLIVGWWQILLIVVFVSRKIYEYAKSRRTMQQEKLLAQRRRFSSDFDPSDLGLDEMLRSQSLDEEDLDEGDGFRADYGELRLA